MGGFSANAMAPLQQIGHFLPAADKVFRQADFFVQRKFDDADVVAVGLRIDP
jgi:hypothetical protein